MTITNEQLLHAIPKTLREELLSSYQEIINNYIEHRWEPSELNGGKLCEVVYSILKGYIDSSFPSHASKPRNMVDACRALEQSPSTLHRSARIQIPRMLIALYEIRNNRGVGHIGGDVDPNHMDATCVLATCKWILSELVRLFHNVTTVEATLAIDGIVEKTMPLVWEVDGRKRVLDASLSMKKKTLILLYQSSSPLSEKQLFDWVEHSNATIYRRVILKKVHKERLIEYDRGNDKIHISPKGIEFVENEILK